MENDNDRATVHSKFLDTVMSIRVKVASVAAPLVICGLFSTSLWLLHSELQAHHLSDFLASLYAIQWFSLVMAIVLTIASYLILTLYDGLALRFLGKDLPVRTWIPIALISSSISNNFGTLLGGTTIRYRMYTLLGLSSVEIAWMSMFISGTFWFGITFVSAIALTCFPLEIPSQLHFPIRDTQPIGWICLVISSAYLGLCFLKSRLPIAGRLPRGSLALCQLAAVSLDLLVAVSVLYWLMPASMHIGFNQLLSMYLLAIIVGAISQVPGGLGVFELILLWLIRPDDPDVLFGSLLAYRAIYYLLPLAFGLIAVSVHEFLIHRMTIGRTLEAVGGVAEKGIYVIVPRLMALMVFMAGITLLLSGATPAEHSRMQWLRDLLPLPVVETSHFFASIVGVALLLLANGLRRRVQAAFWGCIILLVAGVLFSIAKGIDFEEAIVLSVMLGLLAVSRRHYYRQGAIWSNRFTIKWFAAIAIVILGSAWLMIFAYKNVDYSHDLWWRFELNSDAPRSLRGFAGAIIVLVAFCFWRLLKPWARPPDLPSKQDLEDVRSIVARCRETSSHLALLGDKRFLFSPARDAFIMFGVEGRCYVALGDPVGSRKASRELAWDFLELCDVDGRIPVFYQVTEERISLYVDLGLSLMKLGEEACVPLLGFTLEGGNKKNLRRGYKQGIDAGLKVEIVQPPIADEVMNELRRISEAWLGEKKTAEKGFSLGNFNESYLRGGPIAVVYKDRSPVAFANLWYGADNHEMSLDLMRFCSKAPEGTMEFLFIELMLRGSSMGYKWFNLGMAPLSGIDLQPLAPIWSQAASFAFRHGEQFYNFKGLRQYKEKFHPEWTAKYIAYRRGLTVPVVLANITTLISGGIIRTITR